jgi:double-GTPase-like protein
MSDGSRLLLLGLKGSGKTSYLAALWHLLEASELPSLLTIDALQPDREYLNQIRNNWLAFKEVGRTSIRTVQSVSLALRDKSINKKIDLTVPDLSGESFRLQWSMRKATRAYVDYVNECSGMLLFVHPETVERIPLIAPSDEIRKSAPSEKGRPWTPEQTPTPVQLVELIQFVLHLRKLTAPLPIAIIISAWDLIKDPILPAAWVDSRLSLLSQFLRANVQDLSFRAYGVSALGGDLQKDRAELLSESTPARRAKIVERSLKSDNDLTAPLRFVLGLESSSIAAQMS